MHFISILTFIKQKKKTNTKKPLLKKCQYSFVESKINLENSLNFPIQ